MDRCSLEDFFGRLVSLFMQGELLTSSYYSKHPETVQHRTKKTNKQQEKIQNVYIACTIKHSGVIM